MKPFLKYDPEAIDKWIAALRGGEYVQGKSRLQHNSKFCCLGVFCEVIGVPTKGKRPDGAVLYDFGYLVLEATLSLDVERLYKIDVNTLISLNDAKGASFSEIADYIEQNIKPLQPQHASSE